MTKETSDTENTVTRSEIHSPERVELKSEAAIRLYTYSCVRRRSREAALQKKMLGVACVRAKLAVLAVAVRMCGWKEGTRYQACPKAQGLPKGWRSWFWSQMEALGFQVESWIASLTGRGTRLTLVKTPRCLTLTPCQSLVFNGHNRSYR